MNFNDLKELGVDTILDCLADGAYATDTDRRILFWNRSAERITGWKREDVVGRRCRDNILVHVDIDGHPLCRTEFCPLHRAMVTGKSSSKPMLVFARTKDGRRVPVEATVAPLRDEENATIGGIEVFRDMTPAMAELERARVIQQHALYSPVEPDPRIEFANRYVPESIIGGDFYRIERVDEDRYGFMVADVMGHGVSAALYCMQLRALWDEIRLLKTSASSVTAATSVRTASRWSSRWW